jgi:Flp pilus assembly protein TadD
MSLLIDALNAADKASRDADAPAGHAAHVGTPRIATAPSPAASTSPAARRTRSIVLGVAALAAASVGGWVWWSLSDAPTARMQIGAAPATTEAAAPAQTSATDGESAKPEPDRPAPQQATSPDRPLAPPAAAASGARTPGPGAAASARAPAPGPAAAPRREPPGQPPQSVAPTAEAADDVSARPLIQKGTATAPLQQAFAALAEHRLDEAERLYGEAARLHPNHPDVLLGLAAIAERRGDRVAALAGYARVLEVDPEQPEALAALIALRGHGDASATESALRVALARQPQSAALHRALGRALARQDRWSEAHASLATAWRLDPIQPDYAYDVAVALDRLRRPAEAAAMYRRAVELMQQRAVAVGFDAESARARAAALQALGPGDTAE